MHSKRWQNASQDDFKTAVPEVAKRRWNDNRLSPFILLFPFPPTAYLFLFNPFVPYYILAVSKKQWTRQLIASFQLSSDTTSPYRSLSSATTTYSRSFGSKTYSNKRVPKKKTSAKNVDVFERARQGKESSLVLVLHWSVVVPVKLHRTICQNAQPHPDDDDGNRLPSNLPP